MARYKNKSLDIDVSSRTDVGRVRSKNEDSHLVLDLTDTPIDSTGWLRLVAVADGLGGHAAGGTASHMAIDALKNTFTGPKVGGLSTSGEAAALLKKGFSEANARVHSASAAPGRTRGMGTTLVAALVGIDQVNVCNVGDSRAYIFDADSGLRQITRDHSWEAEYAEHFPGTSAGLSGAANLLTRALGPQPTVEIDQFSVAFGPGDVLLLCSDGLSGMLDHSDIEETLANASSMSAAVEALVEKANEEGGEDNITVIAARAHRHSNK